MDKEVKEEVKQKEEQKLLIPPLKVVVPTNAASS